MSRKFCACSQVCEYKFHSRELDKKIITHVKEVYKHAMLEYQTVIPLHFYQQLQNLNEEVKILKDMKGKCKSVH